MGWATFWAKFSPAHLVTLNPIQQIRSEFRAKLARKTLPRLGRLLHACIQKFESIFFKQNNFLLMFLLQM
jgi:hypothetical protein